MHPSDWIVPDWPAPDNVCALITTRTGGVSTGPYATFNLGYASGDDAAAVRENRARVTALLPSEPKWLKQVHGSRVVDADTLETVAEADAATARKAGTVAAIMTADCLPILITDALGSVVAAAHAGWRGLAGGVIENTVSAMVERGADPRTLIAFIGPGIGPDAFEVGEDVLRAFTTDDSAAASAFRRHTDSKWLADLPRLARRVLDRCGVVQVYGGDLCTYSDSSRFYSYRRDGVTGRMGAFIWRV